MKDKAILSPYQKIASTPSIGIRPYEPVSFKTAETTTESYMSSMKQVEFLTLHVSNKIDHNATIDTSYNAESQGKIVVPDSSDVMDYWYGSPL